MDLKVWMMQLVLFRVSVTHAVTLQSYWNGKVMISNQKRSVRQQWGSYWFKSILITQREEQTWDGEDIMLLCRLWTRRLLIRFQPVESTCRCVPGRDAEPWTKSQFSEKILNVVFLKQWSQNSEKKMISEKS